LSLQRRGPLTCLAEFPCRRFNLPLVPLDVCMRIPFVILKGTHCSIHLFHKLLDYNKSTFRVRQLRLEAIPLLPEPFGFLRKGSNGSLGGLGIPPRRRLLSDRRRGGQREDQQNER